MNTSDFFWPLRTCLGLFLSNLETTIVSTSLVAVTNALDGFNTSSWVITAYLLTYTGFLVILAKLSDIFGRKPLFILSLILFMMFSIGCGLSQSMTTLIILRGFQGIGGGGLYAMAFVVLPEMVPTSKYPLYAAILSSTFALSNLIGPILGGAINNANHDTTWRRIFLLNGPGGAVALLLVLIGMPFNFPTRTNQDYSVKERIFTIHSFRRIDFVGLFLLLSASILFVASLEDGGTQYSWHSAVTLSMLIISFFLWAAFILWERFLSKSQEIITTNSRTTLEPETPAGVEGRKRNLTLREPIFPWRLATSRLAMGVLLNAFFTGATITSAIIYLPQRFQIVNSNSPLVSGYRLLALTVTASVGSFITGILLQRLRVAYFYTMLAAAILQTIGLVLMGYLPSSSAIPSASYGYQVIMGLGFGGSLGTAVMLVPVAVSQKDMAVGMAAVGQFRNLGGAIGIAVCANILKDRVTSELQDALTPTQLQTVLNAPQSLSSLTPALQDIARSAYSDGYNEQMRAIAAFGGAAILATFLIWEREPQKAN